MEKDRLKFTIERFDHYYNSINSKSAVYLALSTFIVGALVTAYPFILDKLINSIWIHVSVGLLIVLGLAIMIIVITATTPFVTSERNSLYYFGSISNLDQKEFLDMSANLRDDEELTDLRKQVHQLSRGLQRKFKCLHFAGRLFTVQFILFIPFFILIVTHIK